MAVGYDKGDFERVHGIPSAAEYARSKGTEAKIPDVKMPPAYVEVEPVQYLNKTCMLPKGMVLPTEAKTRKRYPIGTGFVDYFPLAMAEVANVSYVGNEQHNPGQPLHWDRSKSSDEADALMRHFIERGKIDVDGVRHSAKMAWRAMAFLEKELEQAQEIARNNEYLKKSPF